METRFSPRNSVIFTMTCRKYRLFTTVVKGFLKPPHKYMGWTTTPPWLNHDTPCDPPPHTHKKKTTMPIRVQSALVTRPLSLLLIFILSLFPHCMKYKNIFSWV